MNPPTSHTVRIGLLVALALAALAVVAVALFAQAKAPSRGPSNGSSDGENRYARLSGASARLRTAVTVPGLMEHERRFQAIADENSGNRAAGTPGYDASAAYVVRKLRRAGYEVSIQSLELPSSEDRETRNVVAQASGGNEGRILVVGAHLDSVPEGPGINDNGSGSATVLEIALQMSRLEIEPRNRVRFAFWGAEELGLLGSKHYVDGLPEEEVNDISAYLNFDMVGSPNFVRDVYEGPDAAEEAFTDYFASRGLEAEVNSALDGRSDHGPFAAEGIPTGGLFSGAGGIKTRREAAAFGGEAGAAHDPCYHKACDDLDNLDEKALDQFSDAAAHATVALANGPPRRAR